jgi:hypothetical protein
MSGTDGPPPRSVTAILYDVRNWEIESAGPIGGGETPMADELFEMLNTGTARSLVTWWPAVSA